jgi:hypothetical protein
MEPQEFRYGPAILSDTMELRQIAHRGEAVWEAQFRVTAPGFDWMRGYGTDYREAAIDLLRLKQQIRMLEALRETPR